MTWERLADTDWMNVVNSDEVKAARDIHDAACIACRLTEATLKALNPPDRWVDPHMRRPRKNVDVLVHTDIGHTRIDQWVDYTESLTPGTPAVITGSGWSEHEEVEILGWMPLPIMESTQKEKK